MDCMFGWLVAGIFAGKLQHGHHDLQEEIRVD